MAKKPKNVRRSSHRSQFILGLSIFWLIIWAGVLSVQVFSSVGLSLLAVDLDTILAVITLLTFLLSSYGALSLSWLKIRLGKKG